MAVSVVLFFVALALLIVVVKWTAIGKRDSGKKLAGYQYFWEAMNIDLGRMANRTFLYFFYGTSLAPRYLSLLGAKAAPSSKLFSGHLMDHDLMEVGEEAVLDDCAIQPHSMDIQNGDMELDFGKVSIGASTVVQHGSVCNRGSIIPAKSLLTPKSKDFSFVAYAANSIIMGVPANCVGMASILEEYVHAELLDEKTDKLKLDDPMSIFGFFQALFAFPIVDEAAGLLRSSIGDLDESTPLLHTK
jgi:hypothetical protein